MAATWTAIQVGVTFASSKHMLSLFNGSGSGVVLRLYRLWVLNNQTAAVTGVLTTWELRRSTAQSGGTAVTAIKHDTASAAMPGAVLIAHGASPTTSAADLFRKWMWSNDEPAVSAAVSDELECIPNLMEFWNSGYGDSNVEPMVLRETFGVTALHTGSTAVGVCDPIMEFTVT